MAKENISADIEVKKVKLSKNHSTLTTFLIQEKLLILSRWTKTLELYKKRRQFTKHFLIFHLTKDYLELQKSVMVQGNVFQFLIQEQCVQVIGPLETKNTIPEEEQTFFVRC